MSKSYDSKLMTMSGKGTYTKEMRIANLAKARLARGKKKAVKGKGITSHADTAIGTAIGKGITSTAMNADQTAEGKGYYTQDYVPSNQLNFAGTPLDNMDYSKIRARREDKRKKGEYTYSKPMADNDMPIPTVSGNGMKKHKNKKHMPKHKKNTYEEELVNDGYMPIMGIQMPLQYSSLMKGSGGWNDFVRGVRSVESGLMTAVDLFDRGSQAYNAIQRATPSSMPMGRTGRNETPNANYTQTSGLYEPINEGWQIIEQPLSDRPNRRTSSIASREAIPPSYNSMAYSDRPNRRTTSNIPVERINPRSNAYEDFDVLPRYEAPRPVPRQQPTAPRYDFLDEQARELERYNRSKPATRQKPTAPSYSEFETQELDRIDRTRATDRPNTARRRFEQRTPDNSSAWFEDVENWGQAEDTLRRGRIAPHDIYYKPSDLDLRDLDKYDPVGYTSKPQRPVNIDRELLLDAKRRKERDTDAKKQLALTKAETNRLKRQTDFDTTYTNAVNTISAKETKKHNDEMARLKAETARLNKMSAFDEDYTRKLTAQTRAKIERDEQEDKRKKRKQKAHDEQQAIVSHVKQFREKQKAKKEAIESQPKIKIAQKQRRVNELQKGRLSEERFGKEDLNESKTGTNARVKEVLERQKKPPKEQRDIEQMRLEERLEEAKAKKSKKTSIGDLVGEAKRPRGRPRKQ